MGSRVPPGHKPGRPASHRANEAPGAPSGRRVLNAFWRGDNVVLVERARGGVQLRSVPAEHSAIVCRADLKGGLEDRLRRNPNVVGTRPEPDGQWLRFLFPDRDTVDKFVTACANSGITTYEGGISPTLRYVVDHDLQVDRPRIAWFDFETDSRVPFSRKLEMRVLSWALVDADGREELDVLCADTNRRERELLGNLWDVLDEYDMILAWNGDRFDFPILKHRSEGHGLMIGREWRRHLWCDHLELFRRSNMMAAESGDEKTSLRLEDVGQAVLGYGKNDFDASKTWEAWAAGGQRRKEMLEYNLQDARLMPAIEAKTGYVELLLTLGQVCGTFADSRGINPTTQVEGYLQRLAKRRGQYIPTRKTRRATNAEKYRGAFVMEPTRQGILTDVHVADFSGLYPNIIRTWNMSPETVLRRDEVECDLDGTPLDAGVSLSPLTEVYFSTAPQGILPAAVAELMKLRKQWKEKKAAATPGTSAWKEADRRSTAYKIATNSFYGVIGAPTSRFFRRDVAESVAQCGAWLIQETIGEAERQGFEVIYGDTDSLFVIGATQTQFETFVRHCNERLYPELLPTVGCSENHIDLGYEKAFKRLVLVKAKRYIGSYSHFDGTEASADSKPEIKGLEYKRGDSVRLARELQREAAHLLVGYKCEPSDDPRDYERLLKRWKARVLLQPLQLQDVVVSKRLSRPLDGYVRKLKKDGAPARQPPHVEMARVLEQRGEDVGEGARIDYFVKDGSAKPVELAPARDWQGDCDRRHLWETLVAPPTVRLLQAAFPGHDWKPTAKIAKPAKRRKRRVVGSAGR